MTKVQSVRLEGAPFGLPPLHACVVGGRVLAARRASDLAQPSTRPNSDCLCGLITATASNSPVASLFEEIIRVPADTSATIHRDGRITIAPRERSLKETATTPIEAADEMWRRLLISVRNATIRSRHVAVATGGGVDSSGILAAAIAVCRGANPKEVDAVALHFAGGGDDRPHLRELEKELGITAIKVSPRDGGPMMLPILASPEMPGWSWSGATDYSLFRAARAAGADVVLTGLGGDDLLDGFPRALGRDFLRGRVGSLTDAVRLQPSSRSRMGRINNFIVRPIIANAIPRRVSSARRSRSLSRERPWAGPTLRHFLDEQSAAWAPDRFESATERFDLFAKATYLADAVEICGELASRAAIPLAHPFLDVSFVEFVSELPPTLLLHADRLRGLFRLAIRGSVPTSVRLRTTKAEFLSAWRETLNAAGGVEILRDLATVRECAKLGLVDPSAFHSAFADLERDDVTFARLWPVLGVEGFLRARAALA